MAAKTIERPLDIIRLCLDERVVVRLKGSRELKGKLFVSTLDCGLPLNLGPHVTRKSRDNSGVSTQRLVEGGFCAPCFCCFSVLASRVTFWMYPTPPKKFYN